MFSVRLLAVLVLVLPALSVALTPEVKPEDLKYLGCYEDAGRHKGDRVFRGHFFNARPQIDWTRWKDLSYIVRICANELLKSGKTDAVFSVQDWGECRNDSDPNRYKSFRQSSKCLSHVAGPYVNAVYQIKIRNENCNADPDYANGRIHYIHHGPLRCDACKCNEGHTDCKAMACQHAFPCEKYRPPSRDDCCGKCACHHLGKDKMNGEEWDDRRINGTCMQCRCMEGKAWCTKALCSENCPNPEYIPGRCCPRCMPKAPTTSPWEIITKPTTRPVPTFPPWLAGAFRKRSLRKKRSSRSKVFRKKTLRGY